MYLIFKTVVFVILCINQMYRIINPSAFLYNVLHSVNTQKYISIVIYNNNNNIYLLQLGCHPVAVVIFTCKQNMKLVTTKFKSGGLHEKHVVATWNLGNHLSICF